MHHHHHFWLVVLTLSMALFQRGVSSFSRQYCIATTTSQNGRIRLPLASKMRVLSRRWASVTGTVYQDENNDSTAPVVTLFTKEGCTLCDKVKDVLSELRDEHPHSLQQQDITDADAKDWFRRYKYDIPVLHLDGEYWVKHRLTREEAVEGLTARREGRFVSPNGEPNASQMEHK